MGRPIELETVDTYRVEVLDPREEEPTVIFVSECLEHEEAERLMDTFCKQIQTARMGMASGFGSLLLPTTKVRMSAVVHITERVG